jgi:hypothetical protein
MLHFISLQFVANTDTKIDTPLLISDCLVNQFWGTSELHCQKALSRFMIDDKKLQPNTFHDHCGLIVAGKPEQNLSVSTYLFGFAQEFCSKYFGNP